jgi:hypothetical protein
MLGRPKTVKVIEKVITKDVPYAQRLYYEERSRKTPAYKSSDDFNFEDYFIEHEYINSEIIINKDRSVGAVGMTKQAAAALMIPFGQWPHNIRRISKIESDLASSERRVSELERQKSGLESRLKRYSGLSFWQRLKFLFGVYN